MAHTPSISGLNSMALQGLRADSVGMPETGEFDFLNYLLGLQVPTNEEAQPQSDLFGPHLKKDKASEGDQPLLDLFKKQEKNDWQAFAMGTSQMMTPTPNLQAGDNLMATELRSDSVPKLDIKSEVRSRDSQSDKSVSPDPLEDKMGDLVKGLLMENDPKPASPEQNQKVRTENAFSKYSQSDFKNLTNVQDSKTGIDDSSFQAIQSKLSEAKPSLEGIDDEVQADRKSKSSESDTQAAELSVFSSQTGEAPQVDFKETMKPMAQTGHSTVSEMFKKVESMINHGGGKMTVTLTPPSLGQVEIHVKARGKNVEIEMKSESDAARMTIEGGMEELKASLQSQDLNLSRMEVQVARESDTSFADTAFGSFANQQGANQNGSRETWRDETTAFRNSGRGGSSRANSFNGVTSVASEARAVRPSTSRLDIQI